MLTRRELIASLASLAATTACSRRDTASMKRTPPAAALLVPSEPPVPPDAGPVRGATRIVTWSMPERGPTGEAVVVLPVEDSSDAGDARWPLVVALHGRGEALKSPPDGAMGWVHDYGLDHAISRVSNPPLGEDDVQGFVNPARMDFYNTQLLRRPFGGLVVLCPYVPDINLWRLNELAEYGRYIAGDLVPRARRELPVFAAPESTGIDGVSLGGAIALRTGFAHTETFGAVGALQPAITDDQRAEWVELAHAARAKRRDLPLRLTTSHEDVYHDVITRLSQAWRSASIPHDFADIPGPHDYPFNRGPGAIELLLWHDRVLARG